MKLSGAKVDAFLKQPAKNVRAILLFGPDAGMVRERGAGLCKLFASPDDPFGLEEFTGDAVRKDPTLLSDTSRAMSLMGGSPVVRIRDATDALAPIVTSWLDEGGGAHPVIFEAGELTPRAKIRVLFESRDDAAAIGCYADEGRDLRGTVSSALSEAGVRIDDDAMALLLERLGADRLAVRQEISKLILYAGGEKGSSIGVKDVEGSVGDGATMSLDDIAFAVGDGNIEKLESGLSRAQAEGIDTNAILRGVLRHFVRLHEVVAESANSGIDSAVSKLRPPVFFKLKASFSAQARKWRQPELARALSLLMETDRQSKQMQQIEWAVCERSLMQLAQAARRMR